MTHYQINGFLKYIEEDSYEEGCLLGTAKTHYIEYLIQSETLEGLYNQVTSFTGGNVKDFLLNSCDEKGRLDVQMLEDSEGLAASERELKQWRKGEIKLYAATYSAKVLYCRETDLTQHFI